MLLPRLTDHTDTLSLKVRVELALLLHVPQALIGSGALLVRDNDRHSCVHQESVIPHGKRKRECKIARTWSNCEDLLANLHFDFLRVGHARSKDCITARSGLALGKLAGFPARKNFCHDNRVFS
jgi:hypothetical protein